MEKTINKILHFLHLDSHIVTYEHQPKSFFYDKDGNKVFHNEENP